MRGLLNKIGIGIVLAGLSAASAGCQNARGYFGSYDPALKYNQEAQKEDAERIADGMRGGIPIYIFKF